MNSDMVDILMVEDNEYEAKLAIHSLKKHNMSNNLVHLKNGQQAADFIFATGGYSDRDISVQPKIILLDINLPRVNGFDILRMIKNDERTKSIPVVILTSSGDSRDIAEGYSLGANSYMVKPVEFESFSKTINELGLYWTMLNQPASSIPITLWQSIAQA
jgi:two-component system response regulator